MTNNKKPYDLTLQMALIDDNKELEHYYNNMTENSYTDLLDDEDIKSLTPQEFKDLERFQNIKKLINN